jgi:myosin-5
MQVLFDKEHDIVGARVRTYLLERSRLVYQPEIERNYHIFYQLLAGAPEQERKDLGLDRSTADFAYLVGGGPAATPIQGVDDAKEFELTQKALSTVGISVERQWQIFRMLAALLHLGNVSIKASRNEATIDSDDAALGLATTLLGVDKDEFRKWVLKKQLITRSEKIVTSLNAAQASVVRDSVAKFVYSCLFDVSLAVVVTRSLLPLRLTVWFKPPVAGFHYQREFVGRWSCGPGYQVHRSLGYRKHVW